MRKMLQLATLYLTAAMLTAFASNLPPTRIGDYVSPELKPDEEALLKTEPRPLTAGLVLVSDTADPGAAPNLPDEAMLRLGETLSEDISRSIPVTIKEIIPADQIRLKRTEDGLNSLSSARHRTLTS